MYTPHTAGLEGFLLDQHIIYVGGGNTKSMLAVWREWNLDKILYKAYQKGIVLAGISAGANCWFEECNTDSVPGPYTMLPALGFIKGSFCPHYDGEPNRRPSMHALIREGAILPGLAADNSAAIHLVDEEVFTCVSSVPGAKGYKVWAEAEEVLPTIYLGAS
jgi:peptidase E